MNYLDDFKNKIDRKDYPSFLRLWEEYCHSSELNVEETLLILQTAKRSDLAESFGKHVTKILPLCDQIQDPELKHKLIKEIIDIQNINTEDLAELIYLHLKNRYPNDPLFQEKLHLIGLRAQEDLQGAISKYELITHIGVGKFVFHTGGWGTGEIVDFSLVREELTIEFEYVLGKQNLSLKNALKTLLPLPDDSFLAQRFGNPDKLEERAKEDPLNVIYILLRDLGPQSASDIKENLFELVIQPDDWNKWWQQVRNKIKKDTKIIYPKNPNDKFLLRKKDISIEELFYKNLQAAPQSDEAIQIIYSFLKEFPQALKKEDFKNILITKLKDILVQEQLTPAQTLQIYIILAEDFDDVDSANVIKSEINKNPNFLSLLNEIKITALKKKLLMEIRNIHKEWESVFLSLFLQIDQNILRDYILNQLTTKKSSKLNEKLKELVTHPLTYPEIFVWYFAKIFMDKEEGLLFSDDIARKTLFETLLILLDHIEKKNEYRDLSKKILAYLFENRYALIKDIFKLSSISELKEYLLLISKCSSIPEQEKKILYSLAKSIFPEIEKKKDKTFVEVEYIWITEEGYKKLKEKVNRVSTTEMIDNAKEIEEARSHGDLRENAEYKAALERRARLQGELQLLTDQLNKIRILTKSDVSTAMISVGTIVSCVTQKGKKQSFTILGPWEANTEENIISFQSKLAQAMLGKKTGDSFSFQNEDYKIEHIQNYFA